MRALRAALAVALFVWLSSTAAWASSPTSGVHTDPGSPAGKQYVLPISSARGETSGGQSGSSSPPLFGAGVTPGASAASSAGRKVSPASSANRRADQTRRHLEPQHDIEARRVCGSPVKPDHLGVYTGRRHELAAAAGRGRPGSVDRRWQRPGPAPATLTAVTSTASARANSNGGWGKGEERLPLLAGGSDLGLLARGRVDARSAPTDSRTGNVVSCRTSGCAALTRWR